MLDPVTEHPPNRDSTASNASMPCATAGQRAAATALGEAVAQRQPFILLFGDAGVGKTTLISSFLATVDRQEFFVVQLSATSGEFAGPPSFDTLLEVMCRRVGARQPAGQRPATIAVLATAVGELARGGRTVLLAIDHADHLTDDVIAEATRLGEYLDAAPASFVCIFIGSLTLASRLDAVLRRPGAAQRIPEIRVSHPRGDELAALLAYEDTAQPGGPMLTPGAIDRISVYAKANLHWAAPLADAARTLAANQGEREVTPELVRGALFELWSPEQAQPSDTLTLPTSNPIASTSNRDASLTTTPGMSDIPLGSWPGLVAGEEPASPSAADLDSSERSPPASSEQAASTGVVLSRSASTARPRVLWIALAASVLLIVISIIAIAVTDLPDHIGQPKPVSALPKPPSHALQSPPEPSQGESEAKGTRQQQDQIPQVPPAEPAPSGGVKPGDERAQAPSSQSDQTSVPMPGVPNVAPEARNTLDTPSPASKTPTGEKAPTPPKKNHRELRLDRWIQTR
jgi:type II secretory pathway predicted ATPase ExeA